MSNDPMLLRPADFSILSRLREGRNVAANLYMELDLARPYVNNRLSTMEDFGLVNRIGPNPSAGLYEISELGRIALEHREAYYDEEVDFDQLLEEKLNTD